MLLLINDCKTLLFEKMKWQLYLHRIEYIVDCFQALYSIGNCTDTELRLSAGAGLKHKENQYSFRFLRKQTLQFHYLFSATIKY